MRSCAEVACKEPYGTQVAGSWCRVQGLAASYMLSILTGFAKWLGFRA